MLAQPASVSALLSQPRVAGYEESRAEWRLGCTSERYYEQGSCKLAVFGLSWYQVAGGYYKSTGCLLAACQPLTDDESLPPWALAVMDRARN